MKCQHHSRNVNITYTEKKDYRLCISAITMCYHNQDHYHGIFKDALQMLF